MALLCARFATITPPGETLLTDKPDFKIELEGGCGVFVDLAGLGVNADPPAPRTFPDDKDTVCLNPYCAVSGRRSRSRKVGVGELRSILVVEDDIVAGGVWNAVV